MNNTVFLENYLSNIFNDFNNDKNLNLENIINDLKHENKMNCIIKYETYDSEINIHMAQYIVDYQKTIYKIFASAKYGHPSKKLSKEEKDLLEISFKIKPGCTEVIKEVVKFFNEKMEKILIMIPGKDRKGVFIAILIALVSTWGITLYSDNARLEIESNERLKTQEYNKESTERMIQAMEKSMDNQTKLVQDILKQHEVKEVSNLSNMSTDIMIDNKEVLSANRLKEVQALKTPPKLEEEKPEYIKGYYRITDISLTSHKITVVECSTGKKIKVSYNNEEDLFGDINLEMIKKEISESVVRESKVYSMSITKYMKGSKLNRAILTLIKEVKDLKSV